MAIVNGTPASETLNGTAGIDTINFSQGGADIVNALGGDDILNAGAAFDALDQVNGGAGHDLLNLDGDYSAGVVLNANTLTNVEEIHFDGGHSYSLTFNDGNIGAGNMLKIDGYNMSAGSTLVIDGSAETNGGFLFYDGVSNDTFIGGAQWDNFSLSYGGNDTAIGGGGGDTFNVGGALTAADLIDGGEGDDVLYMNGDYSGGITLDGAFIQSIETIGMSGAYNYNVQATDSLVEAGGHLYVTGWGITGAGNKLWFNGQAETDGTFDFTDSIGNDWLIGGQMDDRFYSEKGGSDLLAGLGGDDWFDMGAFLDPNDGIFGGAGWDVVSLGGDYSAGLTMKALTMTEVEEMYFEGGFDYKITTHDTNIAGGETLQVRTGWLNAGDKFEFDASAETDGKISFLGSHASEIVKGGAQDDYFTAYEGGNDTFHGGGGDDFVDFGTQFNAHDFFDGGAGYDRVYITKNAPTITLNANVLANVEGATFHGDHDFNVVAQDSLVAAGASFSADAYYLAPNRAFHFNGAAEKDGGFHLTGGQGNDVLIGGQQNDRFTLNRGGADIATGNGGDDFFSAGAGFFNQLDRIDGGTGFDTLQLYGDFSQQLALQGLTIQNVEKLSLFWGNDHNIKMANGNVAAGQTFEVDARFHGADDHVTFDGSLETDAHFDVLTGDGNDTIIGGSLADAIETGGGNDVINGRGGGDAIDGGDGFDTATYATASAGVNAFLSNTAANTGEAAGDTYVSIEALIGSAFNDVLGGDAGQNTLSGGAGQDTLIGGAGGDILDGGADFDFASYETAGAGVKAYLAGGAPQMGDALGDSFVSIEGLIGSAFDDILGGNGQANTLIGGAGMDVLIGGGGADLLDGGADFDFASYVNAGSGVRAQLNNIAVNTGEALGDSYVSVEGLIGSSFDDFLVGDAGNNVLRGGSGDDRFNGMQGTDTYNGDGGNDTFIFSTASHTAAGAGRDVIHGFEAFGDDDTIDLSGFAGVLTYVNSAAFTDLNQVRAIQSGANVLIQINSAGDLAADAEILLTNTALAQIDLGDFIL